MISLILAASIAVIFDPPPAHPLPCTEPGIVVVLASGERIHAARATYLPSSLGIVVVPMPVGRIHCDGFERAAP